VKGLDPIPERPTSERRITIADPAKIRVLNDEFDQNGGSFVTAWIAGRVLHY
jgi:hypothetical protein